MIAMNTYEIWVCSTITTFSKVELVKKTLYISGNCSTVELLLKFNIVVWVHFIAISLVWAQNSAGNEIE